MHHLLRKHCLLLATFSCLFFGFSVSGQTVPTHLEGKARLDYLIDNAYDFYSADFARADSIFNAAATSARQNGWEAQEAGAAKVLGIIFYLQGKYDEALPQYQHALDLYQGLEDERGQAAVLNEMGNFFLKRQEFDRSLQLLERGATKALSVGDTVLYSNSLDMQGRLQLLNDKLPVAKALWLDVLRLRRRIRDTVGLSYVYDNLGSLAGQQQQPQLALAYLDSSISIRQLLGDRQGEAIAVNNQGETLLAVSDTSGAIPYFEKSLRLSRAVGFTDLQQWTMGLLSKAYASEGKLSDALRLQGQTLTLKDSLYNIETTARIAEMQEKYESQQRALELAEERSRLAQRTAWLVVTILGVIGLIAALFFLIQRQARKRRELKQKAEASLRQNQLRISRDLHDHLGTELSLITSRLGQLDHQFEGKGLAEVSDQVREAMTQMRETIWAVRSEGTTWLELFAQLRGFAEKLDHPNIQFSMAERLSGQILNPSHVLELYRIGQEAMRNAVQHANASEIVVAADETGFSVSDNGSGTVDAKAGHYGLTSMRERAQEIGASFTLASHTGKGTKIHVRPNTQP